MDRVTRHPRGVQEIADLQEYMRLAKQPRMSGAEAKRFIRVRTRLMASGVVEVMTKRDLRREAIEMYLRLPWWKKLWLRVKFLKKELFAKLKRGGEP